MCRQHLRMSIDINTGALGLLQELLQILQIMSGYQNTGVLSDANIYLGDLRISVSAGICSIQKSHTIYAELTAFKSQSDKIIYSQAVVQCLSQSRLDESINFFIVLKKRICILRVSSQTLQTVSDQFS